MVGFGREAQELLVVVLKPSHASAESQRAHVFVPAMVRAALPGSACAISARLARRVMAPEVCGPATDVRLQRGARARAKTETSPPTTIRRMAVGSDRIFF